MPLTTDYLHTFTGDPDTVVDPAAGSTTGAGALQISARNVDPAALNVYNAGRSATRGTACRRVNNRVGVAGKSMKIICG